MLEVIGDLTIPKALEGELRIGRNTTPCWKLKMPADSIVWPDDEWDSTH